MKRKILFLAVAASVASMAANAATVYEDENSELNIGGRVEVRGNISKANAEDFNDISRARLNFIGTKTISEDVKAFAKYETEIKKAAGDSKDVFTARYLYAGFQTNFGDIYYGQQDNATTYLTNFSDMANYYSGYINELNVATADRADNVLRYAVQKNGVTFQASANQNGDRKSDGFGAVAAYAFGNGLEFGAGYASSHETPYEGGTDKQTNTATIVAAKYVTNKYWIGSTFQTGKISGATVKDDDFAAYDLYVGYNFDHGGSFSVTHTNFKADNIANYDMKFIAAEYAYYYENIAGFVGYKHTLLDEGDYTGKWLSYDNNQDEMTVGLRYTF